MAAKKSVSWFLAGLLQFSWYAVAIAMGLTAMLMVVAVSDVQGITLDIPVSFSIDTWTVKTEVPGAGDAQLRNVRGHAALAFAPPHQTILAGAAAGLMALLLITLWGLSEMRAVFRTVADGRPFVAGNSARLRRVAYAIIGGELLRASFIALGNYYAKVHFSAGELRFDVRPDVSIIAIVAGLVVLAIAEVFRMGTSLEDERSLTI